jgi:hypothetical protein
LRDEFDDTDTVLLLGAALKLAFLRLRVFFWLASLPLRGVVVLVACSGVVGAELEDDFRSKARRLSLGRAGEFGFDLLLRIVRLRPLACVAGDALYMAGSVESKPVRGLMIEASVPLDSLIRPRDEFITWNIVRTLLTAPYTWRVEYTQFCATWSSSSMNKL